MAKDTREYSGWDITLVVTGLAGFAFAPLWIITAIAGLVCYAKHDVEERGDDSPYSDNYYQYFCDIRQAIEACIDNGWCDDLLSRVIINNRLQYEWLKQHRVLDGNKVLIISLNELHKEHIRSEYSYLGKTYQIILKPKNDTQNISLRVYTKKNAL